MSDPWAKNTFSWLTHVQPMEQHYNLMSDSLVEQHYNLMSDAWVIHVSAI